MIISNQLPALPERRNENCIANLWEKSGGTNDDEDNEDNNNNNNNNNKIIIMISCHTLDSWRSSLANQPKLSQHVLAKCTEPRSFNPSATGTCL